MLVYSSGLLKGAIHLVIKHGFFSDVCKCVSSVTRYEYFNKGADMFVESLARLNHLLKVLSFISFHAFGSLSNFTALLKTAI